MKKWIVIILVSSLCGVSSSFLFSKFNKNEDFSGIENFKNVARNVNYNSTGYSPVDFVKAGEKATPCVVFIKTKSEVQRQSGWGWFFDFDPFGSIGEVASSGSGVIISKDGYIVTNNHVIKGAKTIEVVLNKNRRTYKANLIGSHPSSDLALLKIDAENLPFIQFANSEELKIGEWVVAVGNPFNLTSTVTAGIVSAKGRNINIVNEQFPIESFIQTDAAINPGNSGGALVDLNGNLVGINTAIASKTGSYVGYGFAIPSKIVAKIIKDLKEFSTVQRAFSGISVQDIEGDLANKFKDQSTGVYVTSVSESCPDAKKYIEKADIILKINGHIIDNKSIYDEQLAYYRPGDKVIFTILRDGKESEKTIQLVNENGETNVYKRVVLSSEILGADFEPITKIEKDLYKVNSGIKIIMVKSGRIAQMGFSEGYIITSVNQKKDKTPEELISILENSNGRTILEVISPEGQKSVNQFYFY
ncbi:MAG: trypsin-like peptidase domain-containing protein [Bacteroidetes bacterium]|nr:trypsin-like peptidase domain-containing protein [Bacteroidota bacterium]